MKQNLFLFNGYPTQIPYLDDESVSVNDTISNTVCSYCGKEVTNHTFCVAKEALEMYSGKLILTAVLLSIMLYWWIKNRNNKRKEDELNL